MCIMIIGIITDKECNDEKHNTANRDFKISPLQKTSL